MTFDSINKELKDDLEQNKKLSFDLIKSFTELCKETFTESLDLSKGNPKEFMTVIEIITTIEGNLNPSLVKLGNEKIWFTLSKVAIELLMFKESNTFADAVIKFNDKNKIAWFNKGRFFEKEKEYEKAEKAFTKATNIDKEFYIAWFQIASMYEKIELETAYQKYVKIVELFPRSMSAWKRLEEVGGKLGHYEVAMKAQKRSFELSNDPNRKM